MLKNQQYENHEPEKCAITKMLKNENYVVIKEM